MPEISRGSDLISDPERGRLNREGRGGGWAYFKSHIFDGIHKNFPYFPIITITNCRTRKWFSITILQLQRHLCPDSTLLPEIKTKCQ